MYRRMREMAALSKILLDERLFGVGACCSCQFHVLFLKANGRTARNVIARSTGHFTRRLLHALTTFAVIKLPRAPNSRSLPFQNVSTRSWLLTNFHVHAMSRHSARFFPF